MLATVSRPRHPSCSALYDRKNMIKFQFQTNFAKSLLKVYALTLSVDYAALLLNNQLVTPNGPVRIVEGRANHAEV